MSTATLEGHRVTKARLQIPAWGPGWAEVTLDEEATLTGRVTLQFADLSWVGTVVAGGPSGGRSQYRLVGGAGGWARDLAGKPYADDAGVRFDTVAQEAAAEAGETLAGIVPTAALGLSWTRMEGPAHRALDLLAPRAWYVDEAGDTRFGRRPAVELTAQATLGPPDLSVGRRAIQADEIATILPGVVVEGMEALDVLHELGGGSGLKSTIWGRGSAGDRSIDDAFAAYVLRIFPWLPYARSVEYRVVTQSGERVDLQAVLTSLGMPDLDAVIVRPGVPGVRADIALGSRVIVQWADADPGRAYVAAFEDAEADGFVTTRLDLSTEDEASADPSGRVLRFGDTVMMPTGSAGTPAPVVLVRNPLGSPPMVSRVRA